MLTDGVDSHGKSHLLSGWSSPGGVTPEPILLVSTRSAIDSVQECVPPCVGFNPDGLFSRDSCLRPRTGAKTHGLWLIPATLTVYFRQETDIS